MVYVFAVSPEQYEANENRLRFEQVFTATIPSAAPPPVPVGQLTLVFVKKREDGRTVHQLRHLGVVMRPRGTKIATFGHRVKAEALREAPTTITAEELNLNADERDGMATALRTEVCPLREEVGARVLNELRTADERLKRLIDWLTAHLERDTLDEDSAADRCWWLERDALRVASRIAELPSFSLSAWRRPTDPGEPYLAGLIPEPTEQSIIEHDARPVLADWGRENPGRRRHDITVVTDGRRRLEISNVNATPVEARLGADLIYYHENTHSFTLVQYKKLGRGEKHMYVNDQLLSQLERLEKVAELDRDAGAPEDWRLGGDPCFLKLAQWRADDNTVEQLPARGMYLPLSYVRLLLADPRTRGPKNGCRLGYDTVSRYLVNTQFVDLVKDGLVGTVGTTAQELRDLVTRRAEQGFSVVVAAERGTETAAQRQARNRERGSRRRRTSARPTENGRGI